MTISLHVHSQRGGAPYLGLCLYAFIFSFLLAKHILLCDTFVFWDSYL